jgi:hypothetical protein
MIDRTRWPREMTARDVLAHGITETRLSVVGLVRYEEVLAARDRRGLDPAQSRDWIELYRGWMDERFGAGDLVPGFARCEALRHLSELRLDCNWLGERGMAEVLASPHLNGLEGIELAAGMHGIEGYAAIDQFRALRRFALSMPDDQDGEHVVGDDLADLLVDARPPHLAELTLPRTRLGPAGVGRLLELPILRELDLDGSCIGEDGCEALARSAGLPRLKHLGLKRCLGFGEDGSLASPGEGFTRLMGSPSLSLEGLDLDEVPGAAFIVARSPRMTALADVTLYEVDDDELAALLASRHLGALRRLHVEAGLLSSDHLAAFGRSKLLARLESLSLSNDLMASQQGLLSNRLPALRELSLQGNHTTAAALARADLPALTELRLDLTPMQMSQDRELEDADPDAILDALVAATGLPKLTRVETSFISPEAKAKLEARFADVRVES